MDMIILAYTVVTGPGLFSLALTIAILAFRLPVFSSSVYAPYGSEPLGPFIRPLFAMLLAVIAGSSLGELLLRSGEMAVGTFAPGALRKGIVDTHFGRVWLIRMATSGLLVVLMLFSGKGRDHNGLRVLMFALAVVVAWTYSAAGHASEQGDFTVRQIMDLLHLLAASLWVGGVFVLALVVLPSSLVRGDLMTIAETSRIFSRLAGFAVLVLLLTAVYNLRVNVGEFKALWSTSYGLTVMAKIFLLYLLILTGAFNRYVSVPLLLHVAGGRLEPPGPVGRFIGILLDNFRRHLTVPVTLIFGKALLIEAALMAAVLLCAAALKHQTPANKVVPPAKEQIERMTLTVEEVPGGAQAATATGTAQPRIKKEFR